MTAWSKDFRTLLTRTVNLVLKCTSIYYVTNTSLTEIVVAKIYKILIFLCSLAMTGIVCWRIWGGSLFRSELFGAQRGAIFASRRTSDESLADLSSIFEAFYFSISIIMAVTLWSASSHNAQHSRNFKSEQVTQRNKLQQKHLPMPTLVNCSPACDWVISIHFKFHRLRDVRSFVDKCLTGTPGTPLKVFSWIIPVYIRKCLLVSLLALTYSVISFHRGVCSRSGGFLLNRLVE